jgi:ketosteroid isomerase-like protein
MATGPVTVRSLAESYWAAEARRDVDAVMAHYHPDATYQDGDGQRDGQREIRDFYVASAQMYPSLEVDIVREYVAGEGSAMEFVATLWDQAGRAWVIRGINVFLVSGGRFTSVRSYEDAPAPVDGR